MTTIYFGEKAFETDLILFDKDGTLLEFHHFWVIKTVELIERVVSGVSGDDRLRAAFYHTFKYDRATDTLSAGSPMVVAANFKILLVVATVLQQHGYGWQEAELLAEQHGGSVLAEPPKREMLRPLTDLGLLFKTLRQAKVRLGVITSDDTGPTEATLNLLGLRHHIGFLACADSPYPAKPAPQAVWAACQQFGVAPERTVIVGDSTTDLETGRRAGVGLRVGVLTGMMGRSILEPLADVVLESIGAIKV